MPLNPARIAIVSFLPFVSQKVSVIFLAAAAGLEISRCC
jgi:hypothetical protein